LSRQPPEQHDDSALLSAYARGDVSAFEVLLARHRRPLFNFLLRSVRSPDRAEDLLQEVFLRIIQNAADFQGQAKFTTWMYTIARNLCVDHARKMSHRRHASLDASPPGEDNAPLIGRIANHDPLPDRTAATPRLREQIAAAVEGLPEEQREVFLMRQLQGLAFADIASVVGVSENTVKSRMRYAKAAHINTRH
jgi:RNA polymerase sigma-70 factor (ECF subfamily)